MGLRLMFNLTLVGLMLWLTPSEWRWWWTRSEGRVGLLMLGFWGAVEWAALLRWRGRAVEGRPVSPAIRWLDRGVGVSGVAALTLALRGWNGGSTSVASRALLVTVFVLGLALRTRAMAALGPRFSQHVVGGHPPVRTGPYRWFRHPGYVGLLMMWSALMGWWGSPWGLVVIWGGMAPLLWWRGRWEAF